MSKNNLPQGRIVKRILNESDVTYNDFMLLFGKVSHVRTESKDYDLYVNKFKKTCKNLGKTLTRYELTNNLYGLPNVGWFIKNCPDTSVDTYGEFVSWCGLKSNIVIFNKTDIADSLVQLEHSLKRPIKKSDISKSKIGFSMAVVNRIWGGLDNAKRELGLSISVSSKPLPFSYYKQCLDNILYSIKKQNNRSYVSWSDIENDKYLGYHINHKTYLKAFKDANVDFNLYLKSIGFTMSAGCMGHSYVFDDGEIVKSIFEYDFSSFLRNELGLIYNKTYFRDVKYNTFSDIGKKRIDCDYAIQCNNQIYYIEIAGMIHNTVNDEWRDINYTSKRENDYRDKMVVKEDLLIRNSKSFLFLFPRDMINNNYKTKTKLLIGVDEKVA